MSVIAEENDMAERLSSAELCAKLRRSIGQILDEREADIIRLRYGLDGRKPRTQRETAEACGISRSYVSRIEKRALIKLRCALEGGAEKKAE